MNKYLISLIFFLITQTYSSIAYAQFERDIDTWVDRIKLKQNSPVVIEGNDGNYDYELDLSLYPSATIVNKVFSHWSISMTLNLYKFEKNYLDKITGNRGTKKFVSYNYRVFMKYDDKEPFNITSNIGSVPYATELTLPYSESEGVSPKKIINRFKTLNQLQFRFYENETTFVDIRMDKEKLKIFTQLLEELNELEKIYIDVYYRD